jgi:hypothetical protein
MQDHGLFQAICRVNRLDGESKEFGYIVDYKALFLSLGKASITNMSSDSKPQMELKADVKRWLKARGLDYKWLAEQCFVSEVTVYNWMAKKKIPEVKEHIIRSLMTEMPVTLPSVKVETESRVILQLPPDVQAALERKALDSKMTLTDFLATKINEIVREGTPASPSLVNEIEREEFSEDRD